VRLRRLGGAISLTTSLSTSFAYNAKRVSANCLVLRPQGDCFEVAATRVPLPPGIFAFESRKLGFVTAKEDIRDGIDGYPKVWTVVVGLYIGWLVFFERKNGQQREASLCPAETYARTILAT
jgi:hypothetical protein